VPGTIALRDMRPGGVSPISDGANGLSTPQILMPSPTLVSSSASADPHADGSALSALKQFKRHASLALDNFDNKIK